MQNAFTEKEIDAFLGNCGSGQLDAVRKKVADGMPVDISNSVGFTPLMSAAKNFRAEIVDMLLAQSADVDARMETKETPLHLAVSASPEMPSWSNAGAGETNNDLQIRIVKALLDAGADVTARSYIGMTPLMNAAWNGCLDAAALLMAHPQDLAEIDDQGRTAGDIARSRGHNEIAGLVERELEQRGTP